jgi:hypothetical protein
VCPKLTRPFRRRQKYMDKHFCCSREANSDPLGRVYTHRYIGFGAGDDIGGTDISCNFIARQYTRLTRQSYRNDHRHIGVMLTTLSINTPDWCAEQVRTRLPCNLILSLRVHSPLPIATWLIEQCLRYKTYLFRD